MVSGLKQRLFIDLTVWLRDLIAESNTLIIDWKLNCSQYDRLELVIRKNIKHLCKKKLHKKLIMNLIFSRCVLPVYWKDKIKPLRSGCFLYLLLSKMILVLVWKNYHTTCNWNQFTTTIIITNTIIITSPTTANNGNNTLTLILLLRILQLVLALLAILILLLPSLLIMIVLLLLLILLLKY